MNISKTNYSQAFGKQALMTCTIEEKESKTEKPATLYKLNPNDKSDREDIFFSRHANCIARDFKKAQFKSCHPKDFYIILNDKTNEVISCAQTSHRYKPSGFPNAGQYTLIEEASENKKYKNGLEPLFAFITKQSTKQCDENIFTAFDETTIPRLENSKFLKADTGEYYIPKANFNPVLQQTEEKYNIEYLV